VLSHLYKRIFHNILPPTAQSSATALFPWRQPPTYCHGKNAVADDCCAGGHVGSELCARSVDILLILYY